ncbi:MAG: BlaI/MecI/CopY family transcriptional regulator [Bacteroidota bacterium]
MPRRTLNPLGETEMEVLQHVWSLGTASVSDVHARILDTREVAYTTVMTVMKKLAKKGYLTFEKEGNAYIYSAAQPPEEVRSDLLRGLLEKVFQGSPRALVHTLVRDESLSPDEIDSIRRIVESIRRDDDA